MKKIIVHLTGILLLLFAAEGTGIGQSTFDPAAYKAYLETNKNLTASQLLEKNPAQTTYYSSRTQTANLETIPWFDSIDGVFQLTSSERELLSSNFFMVSQRLNSFSWLSSLIQGYNEDLPLFLSADFVLYTLHNSYDNILMTVERQLLEPNLMELLDALYEGFPALKEKYGDDPRLSDPLKDVDLYVSIARSLLYDQAYLPQAQTAEKYNEIMQFIDLQKLQSTTLFTETRERKIDFSQFTPRGHYNREFWEDGGKRTLENYFKAMIWLGRIDFLLTAPPSNPWEKDWTDKELRRMQLGALLLNELLYSCGKTENLELHERIISSMVGPDDNLTPSELKGLSSRLLASPADLFNAGTFAEFKDSLNSSDDYGQKIMSNFFYVDPYSDEPGQLPVSYKLLGQKFLIDSYIFSEVVFDRIVVNGEKIPRDMPDPLDVMAVLGNEDAIALLKDEFLQYLYAYKVDVLKYLVDAYDEDFWEQSLYNTWLAAIRDLNPPASAAGLPYFMQTAAWHQEKLNTQLCSWAELRHDNILYSKQSYTGGTSCSFPYTFLEPCPALYRRLQTFAGNAAEFFTMVNAEKEFAGAQAIIDYYQGYASIMEKFQDIASKELAGIPINEGEITFLKTMINSFMASGPSVTGWMMDMFYAPEAGLDMDFVVADVHTQPTEFMGPVVGKVLHAGNGMIDRGVFLAPNPTNPDQLMAFTGPVASFHTEITLNWKRLTDEEWEEEFRLGTIPERPDWVSSYLTDPDGNAMPAGRQLKGEVYTGTNLDPHEAMKPLDYLLTFPNPAQQELHLRFVLNTISDVTVTAFDLSGRMVESLYCGELMPAEHDLTLRVSEWAEGMYILRFRAGGQNLIRKVMILQ
jgi:hypothetical protein